MSEKLTILAESSRYILGNSNEELYLKDKKKNLTTNLGSMYGDPDCGLIDKQNQWCVAGGYSLIIWNEGVITELNINELRWVFKMRQIYSTLIELLIDPWSDNASIWELDIYSKSFRKIRDFEDYKGREYTDEVEWS